MDYLLNSRNLKILDSFCVAKTLFAFDYDGTLAPIVSDPSQALMKDSMIKLLSRMNEVVPVAILTGRSVGDLEKLLPLRPRYLIGNHGAEGIQTPEELNFMREQSRRWLEILKDMKPIMNKLGIVIEDKEFSLTFHYREAFDQDGAMAALQYMANRLPETRITHGKFVLNVLPVTSIDKGKALDRIMWQEKFAFGIYFGDDDTDEDVFRYTNNRLLTVKVGTEKTLARFFVKTQNEMEQVLAHLLQTLNAGGVPR